MEGFTAQQASRFTGCTPRQLRYWDQVGLVRPSIQQTGGRPGVPRMYSFRDLVALKVVKSLLDRGMSLQRVSRAWEYLNREVGLDEHLASVRLETDGKTIFRVVRTTDGAQIGKTKTPGKSYAIRPVRLPTQFLADSVTVSCRIPLCGQDCCVGLRLHVLSSHNQSGRTSKLKARP